MNTILVDAHFAQQACRAAHEVETNPRLTGVALIDEHLDRLEEFVRAANITGDSVFTPIRQEDWPLIEAMVGAGYLRDLEDGDDGREVENYGWIAQAFCTCGWSTVADDRTGARRAAKYHCTHPTAA